MKEITERTLKVENVSLGYGETTIVKDLSLEFPKGKITAIIGPNGCGKSTLLRGVSRLLKPLNGDFTLDGKSTHEYSMKGFARMVGLMPQHPIAPEGITVADLVSRGRYPYQGLFKRNSAEDDEAVAWALEATDTMSLAERQVTELSGGQRQRVAIVRALMMNPEILLLDEVTASLDPEMVREVLDVVLELARTGMTMLIVTHEMGFARAIADRIVFMDEGRIVEVDPPRKFFADPSSGRARKFLDIFSFEGAKL